MFYVLLTFIMVLAFAVFVSAIYGAKHTHIAFLKVLAHAVALVALVVLVVFIGITIGAVLS